MTNNYFLEYRYIPSLVDRCKKGVLPFKALSDTELWKQELEQLNCEINWNELIIETMDELGIAENPQRGTGHKIGEYYVVYTFPSIIMIPEAKYGVVRYDARKSSFDYYTFESDMSGLWFIGGQTMETHSNYGQHEDMSKEDFVAFVKHNLSTSSKIRVFIIMAVIIVVLIIIILTIK